jgi:hypothetical protein
LMKTPSLVIWQVGTNAVWKAYDLNRVAAAIDNGLKQLLSSRPKMDVVLMDLQYAPAILSDKDQRGRANGKAYSSEEGRGIVTRMRSGDLV